MCAVDQFKFWGKFVCGDESIDAHTFGKRFIHKQNKLLWIRCVVYAHVTHRRWHQENQHEWKKRKEKTNEMKKRKKWLSMNCIERVITVTNTHTHLTKWLTDLKYWKIPFYRFLSLGSFRVVVVVVMLRVPLLIMSSFRLCSWVREKGERMDCIWFSVFFAFIDSRSLISLPHIIGR